jgi:hypothetical protein
MGEQVSLLNVSVGTASSAPLAGTAVKVDRHQQVMFSFLLGDMAAETIDCIVETCDSGGANNVSLKAATQLAAHASNNDSKRIIIIVDAADMIASGKQHVRGKITTGGVTGGTCTILAQGGMPKYGPATGFNDASVVQVKY